jgi:alkylhydroperoxidase family enzyme
VEKGGHENGHISCAHREAQWIDDEAGVLLYAPAIWQSADTAEGAFLAATGGIRSFYTKIGRLDKKLSLPAETGLLIREQVARINVCLFCIEMGRAFAIKASMNQAKFEALEEYRTSPLFTDAERAALDYVTELTRNKKGDPNTFTRMSRHFPERQVCEIVWLVATEHVYNMTNIGLNIHSDMLCDIGKKKQLEEREKVLQS